MKRATLYAGAALMAIFATSACTADSNTSNQETTAMTQNTNELVKIDTVIGQGREAEPGFNVTVHYTGWLYDPNKPDHKGQKFDRAVGRFAPGVGVGGGPQQRRTTRAKSSTALSIAMSRSCSSSVVVR